MGIPTYSEGFFKINSFMKPLITFKPIVTALEFLEILPIEKMLNLVFHKLFSIQGDENKLIKVFITKLFGLKLLKKGKIIFTKKMFYNLFLTEHFL